MVLNWWRREDTFRCLRALAAQTCPPRWTVVVDNGCRELDESDVRRLVPGGIYLQSDQNLGFARGSNLAMRRALDEGADYVWFLNNDAEPVPDALAELLRVAASGCSIIGAKILLTGNPPRLDSIALHLDLRTGRVLLLGHGEIDRGQYDQLRDTAAVTGCAMLVSREVCERLGGFDESYFAYMEDADLCLRAQRLHLRVAVAPRARVIHHRQLAASGRQSAESVYHSTRNQLLLMARFGTGGPLWRRGRAALIAGWNLAFALRSGSGDRGLRVRAVLRAVRDYRAGS